MKILRNVDIMSTVKSGKKSITVSTKTIITPLAKETADTYGVQILRTVLPFEEIEDNKMSESKRKPIIAGNWKMNMTNGEAIEMVNLLKELVKDVSDVEIIVAPPFTALTVVGEIIKGTNIKLAAQNIHYEKNGAYTGEVSVLMISDCGCGFVIIGHSERRQYFGCTDDEVNKKLKAAVRGGVKPIVCIGETLREREDNKTFEVLKRQLDGGLKNLSNLERKSLILAYEPVWAIGTGRTATSQQAEEAHKFIRKSLSRMYNEEFAQSTRILYGGSVKPENISELMQMENVDGALVGGASLDAGSFASIIKYKK